MGEIGYFHRVKTGKNPVADMPRVMLAIRGLRRAKVPARRKLPISVEDLRDPKRMLDLDQIDEQILWAATPIGWFFMLRMSGFPDAENPITPEGRHRILISDIDPLRGGKLTHWGSHVDEIMVHISGSKTDWPNQGCVRSHTSVANGDPNADI